ncbi:MAG: Ig-like domain-containing protein, partial [Thermoanaerobaculia bacterium]
MTRIDGESDITIDSPLAESWFSANAGDPISVAGTFTAAPGSNVEVNGSTATLGVASSSTRTVTLAASSTSAVSAHPVSSLASRLSPLASSPYSATAAFSSSDPTPIIARVSQPDGLSAITTIFVHHLSGAPAVKDVFPADGATSVDPAALILVSFSAPMDRASLSAAFTLENMSGMPVAGQMRLDRDVLSFAPATTLNPGERYTVRLSTAAKDLAGNALASEFTSSFTISTTAPSTAPVVNPVASPLCSDRVALSGTALAGSRLRIDFKGVPQFTAAASDGTWHFDLAIPAESGFDVVRVRIVGGDGTLSPAAEVKFQVDCAGPQLLGATYDRTTNIVTVACSKPMDLASASTGPNAALSLQLADGTILGGTVGEGTTSSSLTLTPASDLTQQTFTLNVTTAIKDTTGRNLVSGYTQTFATGSGSEPPPTDGTGYISGKILDAATGRPLAGADITIDVPVNAFARGEQAHSLLSRSTGSAPMPLGTSGSPLPVHTQASGAIRTSGRGVRGEGQLRALSEIVSAASSTLTTDATGTYTTRLPEGAYTIHASAPGYTEVWRQIVVPAGQGVLPIDIRLTPLGATGTVGTASSSPEPRASSLGSVGSPTSPEPRASSLGSVGSPTSPEPRASSLGISSDLTLSHGGETTVTRPATLTVPTGAVTSGTTLTLTSVGGQSLAGLLPLGWSPLASTEISSVATSANAARGERAYSLLSPKTSAEIGPASANRPASSLAAPVSSSLVSRLSSLASLPNSTLTFTVPYTDITSAAQTLTAVRYDSDRDEWIVLEPVVSITSDGPASITVDSTGAYALVYPDKDSGSTLQTPPLPIPGSALAGVTPVDLDPTTITASLTLDPSIVLPSGRTVGTLTVSPSLEPPASSLAFPSGTAVQAFVHEELRLVDGTVVADQPFSADLVLYRTLSGAPATAAFHLQPSAKAATVPLQIGYDHIRVFPYPGRLDRGTLIGPEGGRVPSDGGVELEIPPGAATEPLHASA